LIRYINLRFTYLLALQAERDDT